MQAAPESGDVVTKVPKVEWLGQLEQPDVAQAIRARVVRKAGDDIPVAAFQSAI
jgi:hypothetical protein